MIVDDKENPSIGIQRENLLTILKLQIDPRDTNSSALANQRRKILPRVGNFKSLFTNEKKIPKPTLHLGDKQVQFCNGGSVPISRPEIADQYLPTKILKDNAKRNSRSP